MHKVVGIGDWKSSDNVAETVVTYALATCVAVTAYCPVRKAAGMIHILLPAPHTKSDELQRPSRFATTGVPLLIRHMKERYGCKNETLVVNVYGGATSMKRRNPFMIGDRNVEQVQQELRKIGITPRCTDVGGGISRTLEMSVATGEIRLKTLPLTS
ncbi:chemotaxis protein CheD [Cohnella yongneupensis]|uniref:Probable chemoreceptor glutamine deamidase CheD n=1 Tax=Cohnella yongneupensis TaxID=425006 RepID=A0ABW0R0S3_9BACL